MSPCLTGITIYPIKSLDGHDVAEALVLPGAGLANDRRWRLVDMEGRVLNAKRTPLFHAIRAAFDLEQRLVTLSTGSAAPETFPIQPGSHGPCGWLSEAFGMDVLLEERDGGFPDDRDAPGPTLATTATLEMVAAWHGFDLDEARRRFRINLEVDGAPPFWEDAIASPLRPHAATNLPVDPYADLPPPDPQQFSIGDARFLATGVCRRCVVPTRKSRSGEPELGFREIFEAHRRRALPKGVDATAWNGFYRLGINTRVDTAGQEAVCCNAPVQRG
jgi:uncharacterized protein YcbX